MLQQGQCYILVYILPGGKGIRAQGEKKIQKKKNRRKMVQVCKLNQCQCSICFCEDNGR